MLHAHGGDVFRAAEEAGLSPNEIVDFSANVNSRPLPEAVAQAIRESASLLERYPDPSSRALRESAAKAFGAAPECVLAGSGSTEFLYAVPRRLRPRRAVILAPCYHDYWRAVERAGGEAEGVLASEGDEFLPDMEQLEPRLSGVEMVFLGNPNNPTGVAIAANRIRALAQKFPSAVFLVDESLVEFVPESVGASLLGAPLPENVVVLRTLSLFYGLPGLRVGFMIASAELCAQVERVREPWTVGVPAQRAAQALLEGERDAAALRQAIMAERERVRDALSRVTGLRVFRSQTNFLLLKITKPNLTASVLCERMLKQKMLIRNTAGFRGLDGKFVRVSIRSAADNDLLIGGLQNALEEGKWK